MAFVLWSGIALLVIAVAVQVRRIARLRDEVRERDERLAAVSHELRGPLQPITLAVSRLRREGDLTPKQRDAVEVIAQNLEAETRLIEDLWETAFGDRPRSVHVEPCDANAIVREITDAARARAAEKGVTLDVRLDPAEPQLLADPVRLRQIVRNVLDNAIKFTPQGGSVTVRSDRGERSTGTIEVADTGPGIAPADQARIFEPWVQAGAKDAAGLGLGLPLARKLAEAQGGSLTLRSEGIGRGSSFTLSMPQAHGSPKSAGGPANSGGRRVLLAEDHEDSARMMGDLLRAKGYVVTAVGSLAAGLAEAARSRFDVLISDIELPDGSGLDLMRAVGAAGPIRAIALSGRRTAEDLAASRRAGFQTHLLKPLDFDALVAAIQGR